MKIGILTQPLKTNYGGLLQAFALKKSLNDLKHEVWIVDRDYPKIGTKQKLINQIKRLIPLSNISFSPNEIENSVITEHTNYFKEKYIQPTTRKYHNSVEMLELNSFGFNAYVVGSDQVWRPKYSPCITDYFLDFVSDECKVKRISYSASYGVDDWEFTEEQTKNCSKLTKKFNAVSVREASGLNLSEKYLGVMATHVLDPTMLLNVDEYIKLIKEEEEELTSEGNLMTYVLDITREKEMFIEEVAKNLNLTPFTVMQKHKLSRKAKIDNAIFPPVTKWLKGFFNAKFVITDSFHGCAFAILFNKPFIALGNRKRGIARFTSLLKMFDLEDRLITDHFAFEEDIVKGEINWERVNEILSKHRSRSLNFLINNLKSE